MNEHGTQPGHHAAVTRPDLPAYHGATQPSPALYPGPPPVPPWTRRRRALRERLPDAGLLAAIVVVLGLALASVVIGVGTNAALHVASHYLHRGTAKSELAPALRTQDPARLAASTPARLPTLTPAATHHRTTPAATPATAPAPAPTAAAVPTPSPAPPAAVTPSPSPSPAPTSPAPATSSTPAPTTATTPASPPPATDPGPTATSAPSTPTPAGS